MTERLLPIAKKKRYLVAAKRPRPQAMKPVKGVGRHGNRGYCAECGHIDRQMRLPHRGSRMTVVPAPPQGLRDLINPTSIGIYGLHYYDYRERTTACHGYFEDEREARDRARRNNDAGTTTGSYWYVSEAVLHFKAH